MGLKIFMGILFVVFIFVMRLFWCMAKELDKNDQIYQDEEKRRLNQKK